MCTASTTQYVHIINKVYDANEKVENIMVHYRVTSMAGLR
jgi:hypothetical protein